MASDRAAKKRSGNNRLQRAFEYLRKIDREIGNRIAKGVKGG
jgi:hypothetical protein